jgi:hypothetical protein
MKTFTRVWLGISLISIGLGIALLIIAFAAGVHWREAWQEGWSEDKRFITMEESYDGVKNLNIDIDYGKVELVKGEEFSISAKNIFEDELESYVEDGIWYISEDDGNQRSFLGINFDIRRAFSWDGSFTPQITITIPEDFIATDFVLKIGAGTITAEEINAESGEFNVGAGRMEIKELSVSGASRYTVGAGEMILKGADIKDITVDCGVGNVEISGEISGDSDIKCGVGNVDLELRGTSKAYDYEVTSGLGNIDIDGDSYNNINGKVINHNEADGSLKLDCGIGHISVEFNEK